MKDRLKEIKYLIYCNSEIIKQCRKEIKELHQEADMLTGYQNIEKQKRRVYNGKNIK